LSFGVSFAEANLTGYFQIGINNLKTTTAGTALTQSTLEDTNANTALNFTDVEDLGDGLKVTTNIGLTPSVGSKATAAGQTTYAALSGGFGELKAGTFGNDQFWTVVAGGLGARQHHDSGRPDRVRARRCRPNTGESENRFGFRQGAARHPAPGPGHHHDRRNPRPRNRANRGTGLAHRPPSAWLLCTPTTRSARSRV